jgi:hypothetical protein
MVTKFQYPIHTSPQFVPSFWETEINNTKKISTKKEGINPRQCVCVITLWCLFVSLIQGAFHSWTPGNQTVRTQKREPLCIKSVKWIISLLYKLMFLFLILAGARQTIRLSTEWVSCNPTAVVFDHISFLYQHPQQEFLFFIGTLY